MRSEAELSRIQNLREKILDLQLSQEYLESRNLLRWLKARNENVKDAEIMIRKNIEWLKRVDLQRIQRSEMPSGWAALFPCTILGFDYTGSPVFFGKLGEWDVHHVVTQGHKEEFYEFCVLLVEDVWSHCQTHGGETLGQFVAIYDMQGLSWRQISSTQVIEVVLRVVRDYEANYPESLKKIFILNVPWIFKILWKIIRPFISERTHSKIIFLGSESQVWHNHISQLLPIELLPKQYGGNAPAEISYLNFQSPRRELKDDLLSPSRDDP